MQLDDQDIHRTQLLAVCHFMAEQQHRQLEMRNCRFFGLQDSDSDSSLDFGIDNDLLPHTMESQMDTHSLELTKTNTKQIDMTFLHHFDIDHSRLGSSLSFFCFSQLVSFSARGNDLSHEHLVSILQVPCLEKLILSQNPLGDEGMRVLCEYIHSHPQLHTLHVSYTRLTMAGLVPLVELLEQGWKVRHLSIMNNEFGWKGVSLLCDALSDCMTLDQLILGHTGSYAQKDENDFDASLGRLLSRNTPIQELVLFGLERVEHVIRAVQEHTLIQGMTWCACGPLVSTQLASMQSILTSNESIQSLHVDATNQDVSWTLAWLERNQLLLESRNHLVPCLLDTIRKAVLVPLPWELVDQLIDVVLRPLPARDRSVVSTWVRSRRFLTVASSQNVYLDWIRHVYSVSRFNTQ
jgi:hypothetical protein